MTEESSLQPLIDALRWYDDDSRLKRAERIQWAYSLYPAQGMVSGELVQLSLMEEARVCFTNGQFLATVVCAASTIEHLLVAALEEMGVHLEDGSTLGPLIKKVKDEKLLQMPVIKRLRKLTGRRNPVAHRGDGNDKSTIVFRFLQHGKHPTAVMEGDARFAIEVMYEVFLLLLKRGA